MKQFSLKSVALVGVVASSAVIPLGARAQILVYFGADSGAGLGSPLPASTAAATAFDAAASSFGTLHVLNFESTPLVLINTYSPVAGLTITASPQAAVLNAPTSSQSNFSGFNTTPGGTNYNFMNGGNETFTFSPPIVGFGAFVTGVQNNATYTFNDGTSQTISFAALFNVGIFGGSFFVGFIDPGRSISSVTLTIANQLGVGDPVGVDDIRYITPVPESSTGAMLCSGLLTLAVAARVRRVIARETSKPRVAA